MKLLKKGSKNHMKMQKSVMFAEKQLKINMLKTKNIVKLEIIIIIQGNVQVLHIACILNYSVPKWISIVFHNGSNYDYDLILRQLAEEFEEVTCLAENTEKYITF